ncbi:glucose-6-phosphate-specific signal transduction histidine kinase [Cryobacterium sp. CAN_C3]|nr:glucose-6-phosphate-specific signal transduction histidine kinase [Cryobacterium sp. CAN_C3]
MTVTEIIASLGPLILFVLIVFLGVDLSKQFPKKKGRRPERWRVLLLVCLVVATVPVLASLMG